LADAQRLTLPSDVFDVSQTRYRLRAHKRTSHVRVGVLNSSYRWHQHTMMSMLHSPLTRDDPRRKEGLGGTAADRN
jgi:hypothetical protein